MSAEPHGASEFPEVRAHTRTVGYVSSGWLSGFLIALHYNTKTAWERASEERLASQRLHDPTGVEFWEGVIEYLNALDSGNAAALARRRAAAPGG